MLVAMNFHRLYKKDTLSKYFNTIYNVVLKETRRIDAFIAEEHKNIDDSLRRLVLSENNVKIEWEEASVGSEPNKDLFSTMIGTFLEIQQKMGTNKRRSAGIDVNHIIITAYLLLCFKYN
jgi:hypothetical protein